VMKPNCDQDSKSKIEDLPKAAGIPLPRWLMSRQARRISEYVVSVLMVLLATVLRLGLDPVLGEHHPFTLYFGAVAIASWYGGFGPGILAIVLSYLGADWFFITPRFELNWPKSNLDEFLALMAFVFSSLAITFTAKIMREALHRAQRKQHELELEITERERAQEALSRAQAQLRQYANELEERVQERTADLQETVRSLEGVCYHIARPSRPAASHGRFQQYSIGGAFFRARSDEPPLSAKYPASSSSDGIADQWAAGIWEAWSRTVFNRSCFCRGGFGEGAARARTGNKGYKCGHNGPGFVA